jgi:hypothetical protein
MCCKDCNEKDAFYDSFEDGIAYEEEILSDCVIRTFHADTPSHLLKWHYDEEDRNVSPLDPTDWKFQFDDELPFIISGNIYIERGRYHRIIKGTGNLKVKIEK